MIYRFVDDHRSSFPVKKMCQVLQVAPSGYYRWRKHPVSAREAANNRLKERIAELYWEHNGMAGSPLIASDLRAEEEFKRVSENRVAKLMRELGLKCQTVKKFVVTTDSKHTEPVAENLLNRNFTAAKPNQVWVTDITYIRVGRKWHYLSVFIDLFSRAVVSWDLSDSLDRSSVIHALKKGIARRKPGKGLMIHSDRGIQYASKDFRNLLKNHEFVQSMSRKGNCWDNAVAESFFHTLKTQLVHHRTFKTVEETQQELFVYIEAYYNRRRRHSTNGYISPANYEELYNLTLKEVA